jgi:N,N'-diacetyllegionaminate synthase
MNFNKLLKTKTIIVAEIGNNHEGSLSVAKKLIDEAKKCGVDAVKFQTFLPEKFIYKKNKKRIKQIKKFQLSFEQFSYLSKYTKKKKLIFISTPFDIESAIFLNKIQNIFKVSSGDNNFYPLLNTIARFNKTIILSTGLMQLSEIKKTVSFINKIWTKIKKNKKKLILLHCVSSYPVENRDANIMSISYLKDKFKNNIIGYSDHTIGNSAAVGAVYLGAKVIEKHFTLNNNYSSFRDHKLSLNPKNMKKLVEEIRKAEELLGEYKKKPNRTEEKNITTMRRSISINEDKKKGEKIDFKDLIWVRSTKGLRPGREKKILKKAKKNYRSGDLLL